MKNISVSDNVHKQLIQLRNQFGFKHYSMTIEKLIESYYKNQSKPVKQSVEEKVDTKLKQPTIDEVIKRVFFS